MPQPSPSRRARKPVLTVPEKSYEVVGLQLSGHMPIWFGGREYDLANLSADDLEYLLGFPEQVPYLKLKSASQPG